jgi:orotidine-5'-phosphate decarboxylase
MNNARFAQFGTFPERLANGFRTSNSMLCVGLDPDITRMPTGYGTTATDIERFCIEIVKATAEFACSFKPQIAYFAANRAEAALENVIGKIHELAPHATVILDAKRGDIGATAKQYAIEAFERYQADSVTLSPYMGSDSVEPYHAYPDRGLFLLCRTSNPGGNDLQFLNTERQEPLYQTVAKLATTTWNPHQQVGLVVGATYPEEIRAVRQLVGDAPLLVPGIGAQGGDLHNTVKNGLCSQGWGLLINSSRAILYAGNDQQFAQAAAKEAERTRDAINQAKNSV